MESYSVQAVLSAIDNGFTSQMNKAQSSLQGLDKGSAKAKTSIMDIAKGVGAFKLIQVGASTARASLDKAFGRIDTMEQFDRTMTRMTGSSDAANKALDRLSGATTGTAYGLDVAAKATQDFVTRGMHIGDATRSVEGWMDAVAFYGKGTNEQLETVMDALAKMRTKGSVEMEQLNRLFDVGIDAVGMYAQAVGRDSASVQDDLSAGSISAQEFLTTVENAMREGTNGVQSVAGAAKEAGASWGGTFDNMKAATARGMVAIIQEIDGGLTNGALPDMRTGLLDSAKTFEKFLKVVGKGTGAAVKIAAPGIKLVVNNLDVLGATALTAAGGFATFKTVMAAMSVTKKVAADFKAADSAIRNIDATYGALTIVLGKNAQAELIRAAAVRAGMTVDEAGNVITKEGTVATSAETAALLASTGAISVKTLLMGVLTGKVKLTTAAQLLWNAAMSANPIGVVIGLVTAFVGVVVAATKAIVKNDKKLQEIKDTTEKVSEETQELTSNIASTAEAYDANIRAIDAQNGATETMLSNLMELSTKEKKSKKDKEEIRQYVKSLNDSVDDLNLSYNEELDMLNMTEGAIKAKIAAYKEQAQAQASQERYVELLKEQQEVAAKIKETDNALAEAQTKYNDAQWWQIATSMETSKTIGDLIDTKSDLKLKEDELTETIKAQETTMGENAAKAAEASAIASDAVNTGVQKQITSLNALSEAQEITLDRVVSAYETMTGSLSDLSTKIEEDSEQTWAKVRENQTDTLEKTQEFADLYAAAINAGVSESYLNAIGATGPEALPLLREMMDGSIDEVLASQGEWESAYQTINSKFTDSLQLDDGQRATVREYISGKAGVLGTLQSALNEADIPALGNAVPEGYAKGVDEGTEEVVDTVENMVGAGIEGGAAKQDSNSPSKVYEGLGQDAVSGYVMGVQASQGQIGSAMSSAIQIGIRAAESASKSGMTGIVKTTNQAFSGMNAAAKTGMSDMTSTVTSGMNSTKKIVDAAMKQSTQSVTTGMKNQNTQVATGMRQIQSAASSGTSGFVRTITSGMNSAVSAVTSGKSRMVTQVNTLQSSFYSAGVFASHGLANGINAGSGAAIAAARNVANSVAATMRNALQVHSPSKVTTKIGEYASEGAAIGLLNMISMVKRASDKVAQVMVPQPDTVARPAYAGATSGYSAYTGHSGNMTLVLEVDGRELGRVVAPFSELENQKRAKIKTRIAGGR